VGASATVHSDGSYGSRTAKSTDDAAAASCHLQAGLRKARVSRPPSTASPIHLAYCIASGGIGRPDTFREAKIRCRSLKKAIV